MLRPESIEQQRRSIAMLSPGSETNVVLQLRREEALDVLAFARDLVTLSRRTERMSQELAAGDEAGDEAVA